MANADLFNLNGKQHHILTGLLDVTQIIMFFLKKIYKSNLEKLQSQEIVNAFPVGK